MDISLSILKENPAKYFEMAKISDIIVLKRGRRIGRIVCEKRAANFDKQRAFDALMAFSKQPSQLPKEYNDPNHDPNYDLLREAAYKDRGLL